MPPKNPPRTIAHGGSQEKVQSTETQASRSGAQPAVENDEQEAATDRESGNTVKAPKSIRRRLAPENNTGSRLITQSSGENGDQHGASLNERAAINSQTNRGIPLPNSSKRRFKKRSRAETIASETGRAGMIPPNQASGRGGDNQAALAGFGGNQVALAVNRPRHNPGDFAPCRLWHVCSNSGSLNQAQGASNLVFGAMSSFTHPGTNFALVLAESNRGISAPRSTTL